MPQGEKVVADIPLYPSCSVLGVNCKDLEC